MSIEVTTWLRAFFALQESAMEARGFIELETATGEPVRWPQTTGADVIAIAAIIDPFVRDQPHEFGACSTTRRWRDLIAGIERTALLHPHTEYADNATFWRTLPAICVHLHSVDVPVPPPDVWAALADLFAESPAPRNLGGDSPFRAFSVKTYDELYGEQWKYLRELRGEDLLTPEPGMQGGPMKVPRTTNAEVIALADYWSRQLADVKEVFGHAAEVARWKRTLADVDQYARKTDPNAVYPKNHGFWRDVRRLAIHIAVADDAPSKWDMAKDSIVQSVKDLPQTLGGVAEKTIDYATSAAGSAAHGVGKIANEVGKGLFSGFGTPLLVGAGLVGLFLITRNRAPAERAP